MSVALITGSAGLVGSEAVRYFAAKGFNVVGIDNDMRRVFFGAEASTEWMKTLLTEQVSSYRHYDLDIRDQDRVLGLFARLKNEIKLIIHCAAQPSHDWAARDPFVDFGINANGTLNLLEATRQYCSSATFIFMSTNKVYGDRPNQLPLVETPSRWELDAAHPYWNGVPEEMSVDCCLHSLFGASKLAADILVQEYGRYFGMRTVCFRGGCLTGPNHSGTQLHGFLAYLVRCCVTATPYSVFGYQGKQVRDNIHSGDLVRAFDAFFENPQEGRVYNIGGGRFSNCSILEAIGIAEEITGREFKWTYIDQPRKGDHMWYISDLSRFMKDYPKWQPLYDVRRIIAEINEMNSGRWRSGAGSTVHSGARPVISSSFGTG
jgi:CDP-paratose 2-epimerase